MNELIYIICSLDNPEDYQLQEFLFPTLDSDYVKGSL